MDNNLICSINCEGEMNVLDEGLYTKLKLYCPDIPSLTLGILGAMKQSKEKMEQDESLRRMVINLSSVSLSVIVKDSLIYIYLM
ncbi:uncharacterized protein cubi_03387 [Cryptosporidium ubiquitum]|uniref:Uncharacterized protein n=1 Tax=Cryptosporidium ubiquitum TaxID=857276 RepID=A0A1J4ML44_9CRYT|nr:uncharacterized protein cubi_03387 [Cryptosporidium ubiquitum]OII73589.1 hypothetical protein cubi_03387 [Cryptosporidium ubiquitum]